MSRHTAPEELLLEYAAGILPEGLALVVALHAALDPAARRVAANGNVVSTLFPNATIPASRINSSSTAILKLIPDTNFGAAGAQSRNFFRQLPRGFDQDQWDVRVDHAITANHNVFGRVSKSNQTNPQPGTIDGFIGGGTLWGRPDPQFWEDVWAGDVDAGHRQDVIDVLERLDSLDHDDAAHHVIGHERVLGAVEAEARGVHPQHREPHMHGGQCDRHHGEHRPDERRRAL